MGTKTWEDYMKEGPLAAMDVIEKVTGEMKVHTMGYCVGGTLLATTLAWLAEKRRQRVTSASFLAAQVDFTHAGDLLVFVDEGQISTLERPSECRKDLVLERLQARQPSNDRCLESKLRETLRDSLRVELRAVQRTEMVVIRVANNERVTSGLALEQIVPGVHTIRA